MFTAAAVESMSWFLWLLAQWSSSAPLLGLGAVGLKAVEALPCSSWGALSDKSLFQDGDVILGGLFNLHYMPSAEQQDFTEQPRFKPCTG